MSTTSRRRTTGRGRTLRRYAPWAVLLLVATAVALLLSSPRAQEPLHPQNNGRDGAQALAQVLAGHGVDVQLVNGSRSIEPDQLGPGTTVLLPHTDYLGPDSGPALVSALTQADRLVVAVPNWQAQVGTSLGLDVSVAWSPGLPLVADCTDPSIREGDRLSTSDVLLAAGGDDRAQVSACYPPGAGHNLGGAREGAMLTYPATEERPEIVLFGAPTTWTNAGITDEANAAVALRMLGTGGHLLWVLPQPADAGLDSPTSLWDVLPRNLTAAVVLLGAAVLALALGQGRRLGPVVVEPLPAVVRATETTTSRGRLYRQARDRDHALLAVQAGARRRIAPLLGLPRTVDADRLVAAVAVASQQPETQIRALLVEPGRPGDDASLALQVRQIRALEDDLAHPGRRPTHLPDQNPAERTP